MEWFWEKNASLFMLCQIFLGPQFQNVMSLCCLFTCDRASENFYYYPKMSKTIFLFNAFKGYTWNKKISLAC